MNKELVKYIIENNDVVRFAKEWYLQKENHKMGNLGKWREFDSLWKKYRVELNKKQPEPSREQKNNKISIFTVTMNRLEDVKDTLQNNLDLCEKYGNCELVLLDYNSKDKVREWVINNINSSKLKFFRTEDNEYYEPTHAQNTAARLTTGDIISSLPADNFIHDDFLDHINDVANRYSKFVLVMEGKTVGGIAMNREDFVSIGGFDEKLIGYGAIIYDLQLRAIESGLSTIEYAKKYRTFTHNNYKKNENYSKENKIFKHTNNLNKFTTYSNLMLGNLVANVGGEWGKAEII